eukprot:Selendium_serpulae@DN5812_c0_g1_i1.p3
MAGKGSPQLIQQLLKAETESEAIVKRARENRVKKIKEAKTAAEEELKAFRQKEEERFKQEKEQKYGSKDDGSQELEKITKKEIEGLQASYKKNRDEVKSFVNARVKHTDLTITEVAIRFLKSEA